LISQRSHLLHMLNRPIEALHSGDRALAIEPERVDVSIGRAGLLVASSHFGMNRRDDAMRARPGC
jgi:hypothetical protein